MTSSTLVRVIDIVAYHSGIPARKLSATSAIDQDVKIVGDDVKELAVALAQEFGGNVLTWPWQRFAELNEPSGLIIFLLIWRLMTWPFRGYLFDPSPFERLELRHIAAVLDRGKWFEP